jgi:hypothetical protein
MSNLLIFIGRLAGMLGVALGAASVGARVLGVFFVGDSASRDATSSEHCLDGARDTRLRGRSRRTTSVTVALKKPPKPGALA